MLNYEIIERQEFFVKKGCHPKDCIIMILNGKFNCYISKKNYFAEKNDIFVFNKNSYFERNVTEPIRCVYIQFDAFPFDLSDGIMKISDSKRINNNILYLEQAIKENNYSLIKHFVDDIFILYEKSVYSPDKNNDTIVSECIDYFEKHYKNSINLNVIANEFHISKQWLIAKFKKYTNKTPMEYLNEIRLNYGKALLRDSDSSIGEVAELCGFDNVYYFSNTFKKYCGLSPTQYRNNFRL
ncbi:MAG: AraC family transcriptional regulator [Clostridia bacterium]|nr:AraC family transcriptional regulator [Clostridia bacterium]